MPEFVSRDSRTIGRSSPPTSFQLLYLPAVDIGNLLQGQLLDWVVQIDDDGNGIARHDELHRVDPVGLHGLDLFGFDRPRGIGDIHRIVGQGGDPRARTAAGHRYLTSGCRLWYCSAQASARLTIVSEPLFVRSFVALWRLPAAAGRPLHSPPGITPARGIQDRFGLSCREL